MFLKTVVILWLLISLFNVTECIWTVPAGGDTFRFSIDTVNSYVYYERIGDLSGYYGVSISNVLGLQYGCGFGASGELDFNLDPTTLGLSASGTGLTIHGNNITSGGGFSIGNNVRNVNIVSFQTKFLPSSPSNRVCMGFFGSQWYQVCTAETVTFSPQNYSSCGVCDCACATCFGPIATQCNTCSLGYYPSSGTTCSSCTTGCEVCSGPSNTQCSSCFSGYYLNTLGCSACTVGCLSCRSSETCDLCAPGYYYLPGKTACVTTCPSGLCIYAQNASCIDCLFYCGDGHRMSYEGCDDGNLINGDGCSSTCKVEENWSCQGGSPTQKDTCTCANQSGVFQFGNSCVTLDSGMQRSIAQMSSLTSASSESIEGGLIGAQMISGASGSMFATALNSLHILMLFKYCDVGFPPNIEQLFDLVSSNSSSSAGSADILNLFTTLANEYSQGGGTTNRFNKFGVKAFFLSNMGSFFFVMPLVLLLIGVLNILKTLFKNTSLARTISRTLLPNFQWNMVLSSIIGAQTKLALAWSLQFSNPFGNVYCIVNFVIALVCLLAILAVYIAIVFKISWYWSIVRERCFLSRQVLVKAHTKQKKLGILWKSYDVKTTVGRYFLLLQMVKNTLVVMIIFALYNYPLAQCYTLLFLSIIYLIIIGIGRPFKRVIDTLNCIMNEVWLLLEEILMTVFATNKTHYFLTLNSGNMLGWVMIGIILLSLGSNILCILAAIIQSIIEKLRKKKRKKKRDSISRMSRGKEAAAARRSHLKSPRKFKQSEIIE